MQGFNAARAGGRLDSQHQQPADAAALHVRQNKHRADRLPVQACGSDEPAIEQRDENVALIDLLFYSQWGEIQYQPGDDLRCVISSICLAQGTDNDATDVIGIISLRPPNLMFHAHLRRQPTARS